MAADLDKWGFTAEERERANMLYLMGHIECPPWLQERRTEVMREIRREKRERRKARIRAFFRKFGL